MTPALILDTETLTSSALERRIWNCRLRLRKENLSKKKLHAFVAKGDLESIVRLFALFREGIPAFPLSFRLPESEIRYWRTVNGSSALSSIALRLSTFATAPPPRAAP